MADTHNLSPEYLAADQSHKILVVAILFIVLEILFIVIYFTSRLTTKSPHSVDTYLMMPAFLTCISHPIIALYCIKYAGTGRHILAVSPYEVKIWLKTFYAVVVLYAPSVALPKLAILYLYLRIFQAKPYRYACNIIVSILILTWIIAWIIQGIFFTPVRYFWDNSIPGGHCMDFHKQEVIFRWISFPNIVTDVALLILPLPVLWKLHTSRNQKIGLIITFHTFSLGLITSILRFVAFFETAVFLDGTWYSVTTHTWTIVETGCYLIAACLPSFRPLFGPLFNKTNFGSLGQSIFRYMPKSNSNRDKTGQRSTSTTMNNSSKPNDGFQMLSDLLMPCLSDGNNQKGLVSCFRESNPQESDRVGLSRGLGARASPGIYIKKEYGLQGV